MQQCEYLLRYSVRAGIHKNGMTVFSAHQMGTARMGPSPKTSVVDARGECWHVRNLFVADAALFPTSTGAPSSNLARGMCPCLCPCCRKCQTPPQDADTSEAGKLVMTVHRQSVDLWACAGGWLQMYPWVLTLQFLGRRCR